MNPTKPGPTGAALEREARRLSTEVLAPVAGEVDRTGVIPNTHFDALADAGLFGAVNNAGTHFSAIVEALSEGCLATTFVWMQHHGLTARLAQPSVAPHLAELAARLNSGQARAGIVQAGLLPGAPLLTAKRADENWVLDGFSPWCTGWGMIDEMLVAARLDGDDETVVWFMIKAEQGQGLSAQRLDLQAVDATVTVSLRFSGFLVANDRHLGTALYAEVGHNAGRRLRPNGSLALGLSRRCAAGIAAMPGDLFAARASALQTQIDSMRAQLDSATDAELPGLRARAVHLAVECATAFVAATGAPAAIKGSAAERAMREAAFLLVFGSRPTIKRAFLELPT